MNDHQFCRELLKKKEIGKLPKNIQIPTLLTALISIPMLASQSLEIVAFGTLFLGMAVGSFAMDFNWKKRAEHSWGFMVKFIDWGKVKAVAESGDPQD